MLAQGGQNFFSTGGHFFLDIHNTTQNRSIKQKMYIIDIFHSSKLTIEFLIKKYYNIFIND